MLAAMGVGTCCAQCRFANQNSEPTLTYRFESTAELASSALTVTLEFKGNAAGQEEIELPSHWDGQAIRTLSSGTTVSTGELPKSVEVRFPPDHEVTLSYRLANNWTGPFHSPLQFHPVVMPTYFEINGGNGLIHPKVDKDIPVTVNLDWQQIPANWTVVTSFGATSNGTGRCQTYSGKFKAIAEGLYAAGDFRLYRFHIRDGEVAVAIRGQWTFPDTEAVGKIQRALEIDRQFWNDYNFPYFLVTVQPYDTRKGSSDGSGFTNAFWIYLSQQDAISKQSPLLIHEAFHAWNIRRMGEADDKDENALNWFHEGFTAYYSDLLAYRAGILTFDEYLEKINRDLRRYPVSNNEYIRGRILALWADGEIRENTGGRKSLDNAMFDMVAERDKPLTVARVVDTINHYLPVQSQSQFDQLLHSKELPEPSLAALSSCGTNSCCAMKSWEEVPTFELGFDFSGSRAANSILDVAPDGPAYRAGLRDGQELVGYAVHNNDPDKLAKITVRTLSGTKDIGYYPRGKTIKVLQFNVGCP